MLTYEMAHRPDHIGIKKAWLTWHSQNLEEFRQRQPVVIAQDEIIRRFVRGFFPDYITIDGSEVLLFFFFFTFVACFGTPQEQCVVPSAQPSKAYARIPSAIMKRLQLIIKRQGNCVRVAGFLHYKNRLNIREVYWMFGFAEEFLSILLKQPVKLEMQFLPDEKELAYKYI
ncbi:unnamed protein product [Gongylonema pulchrum]|uniref:28S ribosomal protein S24, mitochondrial n=1 Tax=Gongylonema pulchrum TaxID=637853 RepID=A0A183CWK7_9BILA|nr:unnamed protein product [Gongylonema pulchrum]